MSHYAQQLLALHKGVTRQDNAVLPMIKQTKSELDACSRLAVYADGYIERLSEITLSDYPATAHLMGEERIKGAARAYAEATISRTWDANRYSLGFAAFLAEHLQEAEVIALATLESAIAETFWAEESEPLGANALIGLDEEAMAKQCFVLRAASKLLALPVDAETYIAGFRSGELLSEVPSAPCYVFVLRHENQVQRHVLEAMEHQMLLAFSQGKSFAEVLGMVEDEALLAERLPHYLMRWLNNGFFQNA